MKCNVITGMGRGCRRALMAAALSAAVCTGCTDGPDGDDSFASLLATAAPSLQTGWADTTVATWSMRWYNITEVREYPGATLTYAGGYDRENNFIELMPYVSIDDWQRRVMHTLTWSGDTARGEWFTLIKNDPAVTDTLHSWAVGSDFFRLPKERQHLATQMLIIGEANATGENRVLKITPNSNAGVYVFQETLKQ